MKHSKRLLIFLCYYNTFTLGIYLSTIQISLLQIKEYFSLSIVIAGLIVAIQYLGMCIPSLFIGTLSGRMGKKKLLYMAYAFLTCGTILMSSTSSFILFSIALIITGMGFTMLETTTSAILSDEFPLNSRYHICMSQAIAGIGALIGPFLSEAMFKTGFTYTALFLLVSMLFGMGGIVGIFTEHVKTWKEGLHNQPHHTSFHYFKTLPIILLGLSLFLYGGIEGIAGFYADSYFKLVAHASNSSALALSLYWGAMVPSRFLSGIIKLNTKTILTSSSILLGLSLAGAMVITSPFWKITLFALAGFASGPIWPMIIDSAAKKYSDSKETVMTIIMAMGCLGGGLMPFLSGLLVNITDYSFAYYFASVIALGILFAYVGFERKTSTTSRI